MTQVALSFLGSGYILKTTMPPSGSHVVCRHHPGLWLPELSDFPTGNLNYNAYILLKLLKITYESLIGVCHVFFYPVDSLFVGSQLSWLGAAKHVPHLGYLTNWHSTTWSVQLSLSNTRSVALQKAGPGASVGTWDLLGRCSPRGEKRKKSHTLNHRETEQILGTSQSTRIKEVNNIGIRLLIKRSLRVGRELPVDTASEAPVFSWGFLRPESDSYGIFRSHKL